MPARLVTFRPCEGELPPGETRFQGSVFKSAHSGVGPIVLTRAIAGNRNFRGKLTPSAYRACMTVDRVKISL